MAAPKSTKPAVNPAAAKNAPAPKTPEDVVKATAPSGVGAPADNTNKGAGESEADKAAREAEEQRLNDERLAQEAADEEARLLAEKMDLLFDEAFAEDQERTERLKTTQTDSEEGATGAVTLNEWALPEISEFPATVTLENHTRNRAPVPGAHVVLAPYEQVEATVTEEQFAKLAKALTSSARAHQWDNLKGVQVKYDRKD